MSRTPSAIAYLVTAHAEPLQLRRLVQSLAAPWASFFVHIDRKTSIEPFAKALVGVAPVTFVRRRVRVYWGGWSQVEATLRLMQCAMTKDRTLARFALISGACYPLKSNETLRDYLLCDAREHISAFPMPDDSRDKPLTRLTRWHLQRGLRGTGLGARAARLVNDALRVLPPRRLAGLVPYAGSSWFVLTRDAVATILERVETDRRFVSFFRYSHCPDESFFQTLLASSALREHIAGSLTFADWSPCIEQPCLIREDHLPRLLDGSQELFFARKFSSRNAHLLDRIDAARGTARFAPMRDAEADAALAPVYAGRLAAS
ncbi:MAG TPA: beta-1,6-N-acetylglucosaminyltransferase [Rhizomicrobium sp.]|jgi:hypothetical protein|nr:beta-1,6-N-acetylglucosaminyltransferase [Rhizomicrobium sp.]